MDSTTPTIASHAQTTNALTNTAIASNIGMFVYADVCIVINLTLSYRGMG